MKIKKLKIRNYKKFVQEQVFSFTDNAGKVNEKTLILGNNGTGKTSVLQAIVYLIASVTRDNFRLDNLDWPGFDKKHFQSGQLPLLLEAEMSFNQTEIDTTKAYFDELRHKGINLSVTPATYETVNLEESNKDNKVRASQGTEAYFQFHGYQYAKQLAAMTPNKSSLFENVGNIYWYHEQRSSHNLSYLPEGEKAQLDAIRTFLANAYHYHTNIVNEKRVIHEGEFDFYAELKKLYSKVFPGRSFIGSTPNFTAYESAKVPEFHLFDGKNQYELSCMSAGERAIFPILMDFTRWNINNSIIIIDELELHLHPPLQQGLLRALLKLGKNNQFIITSHSDHIVYMFDESENEIIRLPNE